MKLYTYFVFPILALIFLVSCESPKSGADFPEAQKLAFLLFSKPDSIYLAAIQGENIHVEAASGRDSSASFYLSEDSKLLFSMARAAGEINIMDVSKFGNWLPKPLERPLPTHLTGFENHSLIFNDGDGSIIYVKHNPSAPEGFSLATFEVPGNVAHHGAALFLNGGAIAMTIKSEGEEGALPKKAALVDIETQEVITTTEGLTLGGIHGAHSNGKYALFGSSGGVLWIKDDKSYGLIPNPQPLESSSGNWIGTIKGGNNTFIGSSRNHGLFKIDPEKQSIKVLYPSDQIADFEISPDGKYTVILTKDNKLILLDNEKLSILTEGPIPHQPEIPKGYKIAIQEGFLFISALGYKQIDVLELKSLNLLETVVAELEISDFKVLKKP